MKLSRDNPRAPPYKFRAMTPFRPLALCAFATLVGCSDEPAPVTARTDALRALRPAGNNPGNLLGYQYAPRDTGPRAPLVVVLHGCTETAADYTAAGWNELAERWKFYVVYPEQQTANNRSRCFNWFEPGDTARAQGEALSIRQMVDAMRAEHDIDPARVFVTGLSAGGAMTAVMLAAYPDVFAAGAIMAGLPYRCATSSTEAFSCMNPGVDRTPRAWGDRVRAQLPGFAGPYPRVSVWAGDRDTTVRPTNVDEIAQQWTDAHGADATADGTETIEGATRRVFRRADGAVVVETWSVPDMGHGTAVRPGDTRAAGCGRAGAYILSAGVCSTYHAARFFGLEPATEPPIDTAVDAGEVRTDAASDAPTNVTRDAAVDAAPRDAATDGARDATFTCREFEDTHWNHVLAGRATRCGLGGSYVCAAGSGAQFGLWNTLRSWLREVRAGYYEPGRCP